MIFLWFLYNVTMLLGFAVYWPWATLRGKQPAGFVTRMGHLPPDVAMRLAGHPVVWVHAVSVGEALAMRPFLQQLRAHYPTWRVLLTTVTRTGQHIAASFISSDDGLAYFPLDLPWALHRFIRRVQPKLFLAVETELWPNTLRVLRDHHVPVILVNGRVSPRSFRGYRRLRWFLQPLLRGVELCLMQTPEDAARMQAIGAPAARIRVTGNLKWDQGDVPSVPITLKQLSVACGLQSDGLLWITGSTHAGEEELLARVFSRIVQDLPSLRWFLAPRHVERTADVCAQLRKGGLEPILYSALTRQAVRGRVRPTQVIVVDTIGHLRSLYALATVTYVGGSLVPKGGQNPLEAAAVGKPILMGPHVTNFRAIVEVLRQAGGLRLVHDAAELETALRLLLTSADARRLMGQRARTAMQANHGAVERTLEAITPALRHWEHPTAPCTIWERGGPLFHTVQALLEDRPLPGRLRVVQQGLAGLARVYEWLLAIWDTAYQRRWLPIHQARVPVISVGNLTVGGTGKSACVLWLAQTLRAAGLRVAIVSRGHRRSRHVMRGAIGPTERAVLPLGDEPTLFTRQLPDVPVFVGRDRVRSALQATQADALILDDGFQHRRLGRAYDIVTVDAVHAWGNGHLLPRGPLRERPRALARAHCVIFTKTNLVSRVRHELMTQIQQMNPDVSIVRARHEPVSLLDVTTAREEAPTFLRGARVVALSAIGAPASFEQLLLHTGATVALAVRFPDHHAYQLAELRELIARCELLQLTMLVTTEKDWVRLQPLVVQLPAGAVRWYVLNIRFEVEDADAVVTRLLRVCRR